MNLRRLSPDDWATWRDIRLAALADDLDQFRTVLALELEWDEARWRDLLDPRAGVKVVAGEPDPVGLVASMPHEEDPSVLYLYSMWVRPAFRGRGYGEALVAEVVAWAREHGWARVRLRVMLDNAVARRLYERLGFRGDGEAMDLAVS